jgi:hypothetical protein
MGHIPTPPPPPSGPQYTVAMKALLLDYLNNKKMMFPIEYKLQNKHTKLNILSFMVFKLKDPHVPRDDASETLKPLFVCLRL